MRMCICEYIYQCYYFVVVGQSSANDENARLLLRVSYGFSIAGIITGVIIYSIVFALVLTPTGSSSSYSISSPSPIAPNCVSYSYYHDSYYEKSVVTLRVPLVHRTGIIIRMENRNVARIVDQTCDRNVLDLVWTTSIQTKEREIIIHPACKQCFI